VKKFKNPVINITNCKPKNKVNTHYPKLGFKALHIVKNRQKSNFIN